MTGHCFAASSPPISTGGLAFSSTCRSEPSAYPCDHFVEDVKEGRAWPLEVTGSLCRFSGLHLSVRSRRPPGSGLIPWGEAADFSSGWGHRPPLSAYVCTARPRGGFVFPNRSQTSFDQNFFGGPRCKVDQLPCSDRASDSIPFCSPHVASGFGFTAFHRVDHFMPTGGMRAPTGDRPRDIGTYHGHDRS